MTVCGDWMAVLDQLIGGYVNHHGNHFLLQIPAVSTTERERVWISGSADDVSHSHLNSFFFPS